MTRKLNISDDFTLPLGWLQLATVVYGARGSGKTSLGRVLAEEATRAGQRFCAVDLKGDWFGLKSSADGRSDGIPVVVFGGDHQDVPLEEGAGAFVGETVANLGQSCILDLEYLSKGKQLKFLAPFFEALYDKNRATLLLLLDEAQRYAPQMARLDPQAAVCLGAVEDLVKLGRKHGIGPVLFTQRGSGLNKEVSELCDMIVAFRTPGPLDQERIKHWLDANTTREERDEVMGQLSGLPTGTAVFASGHPELKTFGVYPVRRPETFDSSATPKIGQRKIEPKKLAAPDLEELRVKMAGAIERAKAEDPKELHKKIAERDRRIAELEREAKKPAAAAKPERVEVPILTSKQEKLLERLADESQDCAARAQEAADAAREWSVACRDLRVGAQALAAKGPSLAMRPSTPARAVAASPAPRKAAPARLTGATPTGTIHVAGFPPRVDGLSRCASAQLHALLQRHPKTSTDSQISLLSGYALNSSTFANGLSELRVAELLDGYKRERRPTEKALALGMTVERIPTGPELLDYWIRKLDKCPGVLLRVIVEAGHRGATKDEISQTSQRIAPPGYVVNSSTFANGISVLNTMELIHGRGDDPRVAAEEFF